MVCIYCKQKTQIINSRHLKRNNTTWRRRQCLNCRAVFTTNEITDYTSTWVVQSASNKPLTVFSRDMLYISIYESLKHRQNALEEATHITETVITKLSIVAHEGLLNTIDIKSLTKATLDNFDKVGAIHYQAYN